MSYKAPTQSEDSGKPSGRPLVDLVAAVAVGYRPELLDFAEHEHHWYPCRLHAAWVAARDAGHPWADEMLREFLLHAYAGLSDALKMGQWLVMFTTTGYLTEDDEALPAPMEPLVVFRGARHGEVYRLSWTLDIDVARRFASMGWPNRAVWSAVIPPVGVLALRKHESEVVVNPHYLQRAEVVVDGM